MATPVREVGGVNAMKNSLEQRTFWQTSYHFATLFYSPLPWTF